MKRARIRNVFWLVVLVTLYAISTTSAWAQEGYPRTFTDAKGHTVRLAAKPMRIASVVLGIDENLMDLVEPSRIVAMTEISKDANISNVAGRVPNSTTFIRDEWQKVIDAKPDLVLVATYTPELANPLIERGLPVYQFSDFSTVDALLKNFEVLGQLVGEERKARDVLNARRAELAKAATKKWAQPIRAVYYSEGLLFTGGTVPSQVIGFSGLVDAAAEFGLAGIVKATPALIDNLRPDVILIGEDSKEAETKTLEMFRNAEFQIIDAVRTGRITAIPGRHITTVSHNIVRAVEDIQTLLSQ